MFDPKGSIWKAKTGPRLDPRGTSQAKPTFNDKPLPYSAIKVLPLNLHHWALIPTTWSEGELAVLRLTISKASEV